MTSDVPRVEIDGHAATVEQIWVADLSEEGHFTAMQVRDRSTLGLDFHLARLDSATRELFGVGLDGNRVCACIRHALADVQDASVRVNVFRGEADDAVSVLVSVRPPALAPGQAQALQPFEYQRPLAHLKRVGGFGQSYYGSLANANGFDEALFVAPGGFICEGSITNIAFIDDDSIVWPNGPSLRGVMMQVLQRELTEAGVSWRSEPVTLADVASFDGAFVTNSHGMATVAGIGELPVPMDSGLMRMTATLLAGAHSDDI